jgi:hypothetical protein
MLRRVSHVTRLVSHGLLGVGVGLVFCMQTCTLSAADSSLPRDKAIIAMAEMQTIAQAMDICAIDTTYYVVPEALDDLSFIPSDPAYYFDFINDGGGCNVIPPYQGYFKSTRVNLLTGFNTWKGPYVTFQPDRIQLGTQPYDKGSPLDPWGNPYYLFSPFGLLRGDTATASLELYADQFGGYMLVSLGQDGIMSSDDLWYSFGPGVTGFALTSVRSNGGRRVAGLTASDVVFTLTAGAGITVRGLNLGATQSGARVLLGTLELTSVSRWSDREVDLLLPSGVTGVTTLRIERGSYSTNNLQLNILAAPNSARDDWSLYD